MEVSADIFQDICDYFSIDELESDVYFPRELESFKVLLQEVEEYNSVRQRLNAEMADSSQIIKTLVIKAEDARILRDMFVDIAIVFLPDPFTHGDDLLLV